MGLPTPDAEGFKPMNGALFKVQFGMRKALDAWPGRFRKVLRTTPHLGCSWRVHQQ